MGKKLTGATQAKRRVALLVACVLAFGAAGCDTATPSSGERIRLIVTPVPTPTPTPPALPTAAPVKYTVLPGDTLSGIASTFGVTVDDIVRVNNIADPNSLSEGQVLTIPGRAVAETPTGTPGADATPTGTPLPEASATLPPADATPPQGPDVPEVPGGGEEGVPTASPEAPAAPTAAP